MNWTRSAVGSKPALFAAAAAAAGLLLSGCAAGQRAQTSSEIAAVGGASGQAGSVLIRNAGVGAPGVEPSWQQGSSAPLVLTLVNEDLKSVNLTSVTSSAASSVTLGTDGSSTDSSSSDESASDTASPSASASTTPSTPITIPGQTSVKVGFDDSDATIELQGLKQTLYPANTIPITFTFSNGSSVSLSIPVNLTTGDSDAPTLAVQSPSEDNN